MTGLLSTGACCQRCRGPAGTAGADRLARRRLLKAAVRQAAAGAVPPRGPGAGQPGRRAILAAPESAAITEPLEPVGASFADISLLPRVVTGTIVDVSPQVICVGDDTGEHRYALTADAAAWRGRAREPAALLPGDRAVLRLPSAQRGVADRIWANIGRVTGIITEHGPDGLVVDEGSTRPRQEVVIPADAVRQIQVRFPVLDPGYLIDVIGTRRGGVLEARLPATSQPAYRSDRLPAPLVTGPVPAAISGSATWHEPAGEPAGLLGAAYPAIDPSCGCAEQAGQDGAPGYGPARLPYLAVGSVLLVRNDCTGSSCAVTVTGCAAIARLFNDRCVICDTSPRGRVADLTLASFVALGGELERGCFSATITVGG